MYGVGRWSYLTLQGRDGRMVALILVYETCNGLIEPTQKMTASIQQCTIFNREFDFKDSIPS